MMKPVGFSTPNKFTYAFVPGIFSPSNVLMVLRQTLGEYLLEKEFSIFAEASFISKSISFKRRYIGPFAGARKI